MDREMTSDFMDQTDQILHKLGWSLDASKKSLKAIKVKQEGSMRDKEILSLIDKLKADFDAFLLFYQDEKTENEKIAFSIFRLEKIVISITEIQKDFRSELQDLRSKIHKISCERL